MQPSRYALISLSFLLLIVTALCIYIKQSRAAELFVELDGTVQGVYADNDENFYILSADENKYIITKIDKKSDDQLETTVFSEENSEPSVTPYAFYNGTFCFFKNDFEQRDKDIFPYVTARMIDCKTNIAVTKAINGAEVYEVAVQAYDGERLYLVSRWALTVYSEKMKKINEFEITREGYYAMSSPDGSAVCCACSDGMMIIRGDKCVKTDILSKTLYPSESYFSDDNSVVYSYDGTIVFDGFDKSKGIAAFGDTLIGNIGGKLTAVVDDMNIELGSASEESFICSSGDLCACFTPSGSGMNIQFVTADEISDKCAESMPTEQVAADSESDKDVDTSSAESGAETHDLYIFNDDDAVVDDIAPGTTIAVFKNNTLAEVRFYDKNGNPRSSGTIGTGMTVVMPDGKRYSAVVYGDITGDGKITDSDVAKVESYLIAGDTLSGEFLKAADINADGTLDLCDAAALYRAANDNYTISQKRGIDALS